MITGDRHAKVVPPHDVSSTTQVARPGQQERAQVVDAVRLAGGCRGQGKGDHGQGDRPQRQVHVEHPAPAEIVHEEAAQQRPGHAGHPEHRAERALVLAAFPRRHHVADDGLGQHDQSAAAQSLQGAEPDELQHGLGQAAQRRPDQEDHDRGLEQPLAAVLVAELAPHRGGGRGGQQVRGDHPGQVVQPAQVTDDRRQGGGHDGLVQRGEQDRQHQRGVHEDQATTGADCRRGRAVLVVRHMGLCITRRRNQPSR